jgi:hypothetical protein
LDALPTVAGGKFEFRWKYASVVLYFVQRDTEFATASLLVILAVIDSIASIWGSVICYKAYCCCGFHCCGGYCCTTAPNDEVIIYTSAIIHWLLACAGLKYAFTLLIS